MSATHSRRWFPVLLPHQGLQALVSPPRIIWLVWSDRCVWAPSARGRRERSSLLECGVYPHQRPVHLAVLICHLAHVLPKGSNEFFQLLFGLRGCQFRPQPQGPRCRQTPSRIDRVLHLLHLFENFFCSVSDCLSLGGDIARDVSERAITEFGYWFIVCVPHLLSELGEFRFHVL
ncbi:hypothetical protein ACJJTC_016585 [Scirpophaga incertulas]